MDVVPANPETWDRNPFELTRDVKDIFIDFFYIFKKIKKFFSSSLISNNQ